MKNLSPYSLGATLYVPATHNGITDLIQKKNLPGLRSMVICLEDSVAENDLPYALQKLKKTLSNIQSDDRLKDGPLVFIRPRNFDIGQLLVNEFNLNIIDGFVLPKFTIKSLTKWQLILAKTMLCWMPTLETEDVFDAGAMKELSHALYEEAMKEILVIRIGGNDLMNVIGIRRHKEYTLYEGPLGYVLKMLISIFGAKGFSLTAPVCEFIDNHKLLIRELNKDIAYGLVGKTAIHPTQVPLIHDALRVHIDDYHDALRILNTNEAIFKSHGAMCEPATHNRWAQKIMLRAQHFGVSKKNGSLCVSGS